MSATHTTFDPRLDHLLGMRIQMQRALREGGDCFTISDIADWVLRGKFQYWFNEAAAVVTEVLTYPRRKMIHYFLAVGALEDVLKMQAEIDSFAREHGCDGAIMGGRVGWDKVLPKYGWRKSGTAMTKELASE